MITKTQTQKTTSNTKELIFSMLTENTGTHMCDSGGDNGRMWQRNANKCIADFENEPEELYQYDPKYNEIHRTVSVFHYLTHNLEINDICFRFNEINTNPDNHNADTKTDIFIYGVSSDAWQDLIMSNLSKEVEVSRSWNTYNGESDLSQILQGANIIINDEHYVLIQIHGGADARGGYTDAKLFKCGDYMDGMIHEYLREYTDNEETLDGLLYVENMVDYWDESKVYKGKELESIKIKLNN
tara:strand:+ start:29 stop:754 length:726 start_codon:yes stop_codon:yes gene_type:complete